MVPHVEAHYGKKAATLLERADEVIGRVKSRLDQVLKTSRASECKRSEHHELKAIHYDPPHAHKCKTMPCYANPHPSPEQRQQEEENIPPNQTGYISPLPVSTSAATFMIQMSSQNSTANVAVTQLFRKLTVRDAALSPSASPAASSSTSINFSRQVK